jgi:hypothetical protein
MELKSQNVQHARNISDGAVALIPRVDKLWYKYVFFGTTPAKHIGRTPNFRALDAMGT